MDLNKAISLLKAESWVHDIVKIPNRSPKQKRWKIIYSFGDPNISRWNSYDENTDRDLIKAARNRNRLVGTTVRKNVKTFSNKKNRAATRDAITSQNFDRIPQNGPTKTDDIWGWD